ncbi:MAG TPA: hypothetical protein VFW77_05015 [Candidatus Saccharimonadales bacterium]|nr:hypothetical protein [Candidatus Saccharimonadales bacterium]
MFQTNGRHRPYGEKVGEISFPAAEKLSDDVDVAEVLLDDTIEEVLAARGRRAVTATFSQGEGQKAITELFAQPPLDREEAVEAGEEIKRIWVERLGETLNPDDKTSTSLSAGFVVTQATQLYNLQPEIEGCVIARLPDLGVPRDSSQAAVA